MDYLNGKYPLITDIDSITLANNTALNHDIAVPTGKRWLIVSIKVVNPDDVARNVNIRVYNEAGATNIISELCGTALDASSAEALQWPQNQSSQTNKSVIYHPRLLSEGQIIRVRFDAGGASSGGTDADGCVLQYLEGSI